MIIRQGAEHPQYSGGTEGDVRGGGIADADIQCHPQRTAGLASLDASTRFSTDCLFVKSRQDGSIRAVLALGINLEGEKELLGMWLGETEGAKFWLNIFNELMQDCFIGVDGQSHWTVYPHTQVQLCIASGPQQSAVCHLWLRISGRSTQRRRWRPPELRWGRLPNTGGSGIRRLCRAGSGTGSA